MIIFALEIRQMMHKYLIARLNIQLEWLIRLAMNSVWYNFEILIETICNNLFNL
jgi:hypothetical protein